MRVDLPRGQWAEFRDISDLKGGDAKAIRRATRLRVKDGTLEEISMGIGDDQMDALLTRIITEWEVRAANGTSLGLPLFDKSSLDEMPLDTYNDLCEAAKPYRDAIDNVGKAPTLGSGTASTDTSSPPAQTPPILQGSAISQPESSPTPSNSDGSPNGGTGHLQSPSISHSTS